MAASIKNILIGIFVLAALGIITFMLLFLHPSVGDSAKTLRVRFTDIDKVNVGTRVTFAGHPVGEVISIEELPSIRTNRMTRNGDVYAYELVLQVDSSVSVFNTDEVILRTSGLLGERNIEINPRSLKPGETLKKVENEVLYAAQVTTVEDTMRQISDLSKKFHTVLDNFHKIMSDFKSEEVFSKIERTTKNLTDITDSFNQPEKIRQTLDNVLSLTERAHKSWDTIDHSLQNVSQLTERAHHSWTTLDNTLENLFQLSQKAHISWGTLDQTLFGFRDTATNAVAFTEKANQIADYTLQGKGTIGGLFIKDDLYLRLKSILHKGEFVMNDINAYGLLFHLDKRWQRLQARRLRLLEKLSTPNEFAQYFNREMDEISSSLSRVSMALYNSECEQLSLINNPDFTQRFADLLRKVENMEETLKLYNEQVIEQDSCECSQ